MNEIKTWLEESNPDFDQGYILLCQYCRNQSLMSFIGRKRDMTHLRYQLEKIAKLGSLKPNPHYQGFVAQFGKGIVGNVKPKEDIAKVIIAREISPEELPEDLKPVYAEIVEKYKLQRALHEKMKQANSDVGRAEFRSQIVTLAAEIKASWKIIDETLAGNPPADPNKGKGSNQAKINSARAYISKMLKKDNLTQQQKEGIIARYNEIVAAGEAIKPETLQKLKEKGLL